MPELVRYSFRLPNRAITFGQLRAEHLGLDPDMLREFPLDDAFGLPVLSFYAALQDGNGVQPSIGRQGLQYFSIGLNDLELQDPPRVSACYHSAIANAAMELVQATRGMRDTTAADKLYVRNLHIILERTLVLFKS